MSKGIKSHHLDDYVEIFRRYITRNGVRIYPKPPQKAFKLRIPRDKYYY
ncbi:MAG: hypothetical protein LBM59_03050 [Ruminococcus sp.]|nr:hypothetical protein [Ruminococcus sp.]